ncbi:MAG: hypothetical protein ACOX8X_04270 [Methanomethylophilus sp.]
MSKRTAAAVGLAACLLVVLGLTIIVNDWDDSPLGFSDEPTNIAYDDVVVEESDGTETVDHSSLNYGVLEYYGPLLLVLGVLMYAAMIGGICIAREEVEKDDSN